MDSNNHLITKCIDTELYLLSFLDIDSILILSLSCKNEHNLLLEQCFFKNILILIHQYHKEKLINNIIDIASKHNYVSILDWSKNYNRQFRYTNNAIDLASYNGHVNILDWFKNSGFEFKYTNNAIDWASYYGHVNILDWFKNSDFEFKYTNDAIDMASKNGHVNILDWFKKLWF